MGGGGWQLLSVEGNNIIKVCCDECKVEGNGSDKESLIQLFD